jgi:hypothetical protein
VRKSEKAERFAKMVAMNAMAMKILGPDHVNRSGRTYQYELDGEIREVVVPM